MQNQVMEPPNGPFLAPELSKFLNVSVTALGIGILLERVGVFAKEKCLCRKIQNVP
jgi:hypothetical protein